VLTSPCDIKTPEGLLIPLNTRYGEGRVDNVIRGRQKDRQPTSSQLLDVSEVAKVFGVDPVFDWDRVQSKFGPWGPGWEDIKIVSVDLETTGFGAETDYIVEIGATLFSLDGPDLEFSTLINPGVPIPAHSTAVHGITNAMVRFAPKEDLAIRKFLDFISDASVLCGQNVIRFDVPFIKAAMNRLSIETESKLSIVDTLNISKELLKKGTSEGRVKNYRLGTLCEFFQIDTGTSHRALDDARATMLVFNELMKLRSRENNALI